MRKLQIAFAKKEKAEQLLASLENLKGKEEVEEDRYDALREEYTALLEEGTKEIDEITVNLNKRLTACQDHLQAYSERLQGLEVRIEVGELAEKKNKGRLKKLGKRVERLQKQAEDLEKLVDATSSDDLGGFINIPLKRTATGRASRRTQRPKDEVPRLRDGNSHMRKGASAGSEGDCLRFAALFLLVVTLLALPLGANAQSALDSLEIGPFVVEAETSFRQEGEIFVADGTISVRGKGDTSIDRSFELRTSGRARVVVDPTAEEIRVMGTTQFVLRGFPRSGSEFLLFEASDYKVSLDVPAILFTQGIDLEHPIGTLSVFGVTRFRILIEDEDSSLRGLAFEKAYVKLHDGLDFSHATDSAGLPLFPNDEAAQKYKGHFRVENGRFLFGTGIEFDKAEFYIKNVKIGGNDWLELESMTIRYVPGSASQDEIWEASAQAVAPFPLVSTRSRMRGSVELEICNGGLETLSLLAGFENLNAHLTHGVFFQSCGTSFELHEDRIDVQLKNLEFTLGPEVNVLGSDAFLIKAAIETVTLYSSEGAFCAEGQVRIIRDDVIAGQATFVSDPTGLEGADDLFCPTDCRPTPEPGEKCTLCFKANLLDSEYLQLSDGPAVSVMNGEYYVYVDSATGSPTRLKGKLDQFTVAGFSFGQARVEGDIRGIEDSECVGVDDPVFCVSADNLLVILPLFSHPKPLFAHGSIGIGKALDIGGEFSLEQVPRPPQDLYSFWDLVSVLGVTYENFYYYIDPINQWTVAKLEFLPDEARLGFSVAGFWLWLRYSYAQGLWNPFTELTSSSTVLVLDTSNSMNWNEPSGIKKLVAAKQAAGRILNMIKTENQTGAHHEVALVRFSETADVVLGLTADTERAREALTRLSASGWTNIAQGLDLANTALRDATGKEIIILLTDGVPTHGLDGTEKPPETLQAEILNGPARQAAENDYCIYVIGFGDPEEQRIGLPSIDPSFLRELVRATGCDSDFRLVTEAFELGHKLIRTRQESLGRTVILDTIQSILEGETVELDIFSVPTDAGRLHVTLAWPGSSLELFLTDPKGQPVNPSYPGATIDVYENMLYVIVEAPIPGVWVASVHGRDIPTGSTQFAILASVKLAEKRFEAICGEDGVAFTYQLPPEIEWAKVILADTEGGWLSEAVIDPRATRFPVEGFWQPIVDGEPRPEGTYIAILWTENGFFASTEVLVVR